MARAAGVSGAPFLVSAGVRLSGKGKVSKQVVGL
jgi:hypothetical protein